jgi:hypothetical protein
MATMRTTLLTGMFLVATLGTASADDSVAGHYDVKFEEMTSTCNPPPLSLGHGKLRIDVKKTTMTVNTDLIPQMTGAAGKGGKIKADTKKVPSTIRGLDGKYSIAGRLEAGILTLVLVVEYTKQADGKPYCTQSWNINGVPAKDDDKKSAGPDVGAESFAFVPALFSP